MKQEQRPRPHVAGSPRPGVGDKKVGKFKYAQMDSMRARAREMAAKGMIGGTYNGKP